MPNDYKLLCCINARLDPREQKLIQKLILDFIEQCDDINHLNIVTIALGSAKSNKCFLGIDTSFNEIMNDIRAFNTKN